MHGISGIVLNKARGAAASGRRWGIALMAAALLVSAGNTPAQAGNSWALPLVGGALGGYAISSFVNARKSEPAPVHHTAPRPVAHASPPATPPAKN